MKTYCKLTLWAISSLQFGMSQALYVLKWNKHFGVFGRFSGIPSWEDEKQRHALKSRNEEIHNFNGELLHLTHVEEPSFVNFYENDTKVAGINGDIWTILSELLNFTLKVTKSNRNKCGPLLANGSFDGTLEFARLNQTDIIPKMAADPLRLLAVKFTTGFWINKYTIFTHVDQKKDRIWMFKLLSVEVWCFIFTYICLLSLARAVVERVRTRDQDGQHLRQSYSEHLFNTLQIACNQGYTVNPRLESKVLAITISFFLFLILTVFNSRAISGLRQEIIPRQVISFENIHKYNNIRTIVRERSVCYSLLANNQSKQTNEAIPYTIVRDHNELYNKVCLNSEKNVLCDGTDEVAMRSPRFCGLIRSDHSVDFHVVGGVSKAVKNKRSLDIGILKLRELGIIERLRNHYLSRIEQEKVKKIDRMAIEGNQVSLIIAIFSCGIAASAVICVVERIFFALYKRRNKQRLILFSISSPSNRCSSVGRTGLTGDQ